MSKSRGNVVGPDSYVDVHGADVLRCALLFTCPWEAGGDYHDDTIAGIERFFAKVWHVVDAPVIGPDHPEPLVERAIVAVSEAIEKLSFNVGLARLMELVPVATTARAKRVLVQLLAPFAPHLAEELWSHLGQRSSVHTSEWPTPNRAVLDAQPIELGVQVNGRMRARIEIDSQADEEDVVAAAAAAVGDIRPSRVIYVRGRLVNLIH
jgi:leucyl-tRNA synthetase